MSGQGSRLKFIVEENQVSTRGLAEFVHPELRIRVNDPALVVEGERFLRHVANYVLEQHALIKSGETLTYGYWVVKFLSADGPFLDAWEYNAEATDFVQGASMTLTYWRDQHQECERHGAEFTPPRPDKLVVVSEGVEEGDPVEGIRYPSPEHMSGWWLTTRRYNGDIKTLKHEHLYHITAIRPELARYVALPYGFCFKLGTAQKVWFDEVVAKEPAV